MNVVVSSQWRASCNRRRSRNVTFDKHGLHLHETDWYLTINFNEADACKDKILQEVHIETLLWQQHMITEVTCSADLCTWGISNIAANWNTDHLIGERERATALAVTVTHVDMWFHYGNVHSKRVQGVVVYVWENTLQSGKKLLEAGMN